jgi:hypothetical protein
LFHGLGEDVALSVEDVIDVKTHGERRGFATVIGKSENLDFEFTRTTSRRSQSLLHYCHHHHGMVNV